MVTTQVVGDWNHSSHHRDAEGAEMTKESSPLCALCVFPVNLTSAESPPEQLRKMSDSGCLSWQRD